jgi:hypothetical protein
MQSFLFRFHEAAMRRTNQMMSVIVMTVVGDVPENSQAALDDAFPAPPGFRWRFVPEGSPAVQVRSILRLDARAVVVWVGAGDAVDRGAKLITRLLGAGLPIVIAVAEMHDPERESLLRQAGALYICGNEARQRLSDVLGSILGPPSRSTAVEMVEPAQEVKMDGS